MRGCSRSVRAGLLLAFASLTALPVQAAPAAPLRHAAIEVPIRVRALPTPRPEPTAVTFSVPFPRGRLAEPRGLRLRLAHQPLPLQTTVLERWPDGSIRWLLCDTVVSLPPAEPGVIVLESDRPATPMPRPRIHRHEDRQRLVLDTGALRAALPRDGGALVEWLTASHGARVERIALPRLDVDGDEQTAVPLGPLRLETDGGVRTEALLRARYPSGLALDARVAVFAGQRRLRLQLTVTHLGALPWLAVRSLALHVPLPVVRGSVGLDGTIRRFDRTELPQRIVQVDPEEVRIDGAVAGSSADGWLHVESTEASVTVVRRWFREEYPQAFQVNPTGIRLDLAAGGETPVRLGRGAARTIELWIDLATPSAAGEPAAVASALRSPPSALPPPEWIVASRALANTVDPREPEAARFLARLEDGFRRYRARARHERWDDGPAVPCDARPVERPRRGFYGLLHWGDWNFPGYRDQAKGCDAWGNLEYDLPQVLGLLWTATNDPEHRDAFVAATRHYRDVDLIHHDPEHPDRVGLNHPHKVGHHDPEAKQTVDLGHTWVEGLVTHWRLTGEVRSREAAVRLADALARRVDKAANPRHFGWPMIALAAVAESTGDSRYRMAAGRFAEAALHAFPPTPAAADWKIGIQADGLAYVDALGASESIRAWLVAYADAFLAQAADLADARYALPLGYLGTVTGDIRYVDAARRVAATLAVGDWGKTLAIDGRTGFRLLGPLTTATTEPPASVRAATAVTTPPGPGALPPASAPERARPSPSRVGSGRRSGR